MYKGVGYASALGKWLACAKDICKNTPGFQTGLTDADCKFADIVARWPEVIYFPNVGGKILPRAKSHNTKNLH